MIVSPLQGRYYPFSSVGRGFTALPCMRYDSSYAAVPENFTSNFESLFVTLTSIVSSHIYLL